MNGEEESDAMIVVMKPANKARRTARRRLVERSVAPEGKSDNPTHTGRRAGLRVSHGMDSVTAMGWLAGPLTSCAAARPEGGAGCLNGHVRICAGVPGKLGAYRDVRQANWPSTGGVSPLW